MIFVIVNIRKLKLFGRHMFSNAVKVMLLRHPCYVPVQLYRSAGSIHLFKIRGKVTSAQITLKRKLSWDIIEIVWKEVNRTLNGNKVHLPTSVIIPL